MESSQKIKLEVQSGPLKLPEVCNKMKPEV